LLYQCFIRGENFPGVVLGEVDPVGFYTTRWVEAPDEATAEKVALESLRSEKVFAIDPELRSKDATVYFESVIPVDVIPEDAVQTGATWFPMNEQRDQSESECKT
jgi:hypothetical protein